MNALVLPPTFSLDKFLPVVQADAALQGSLFNFLRYSSHRILEQALPNFFDGMLPAQRKLLLSMQDLGAWSTSKHQKSSRVVANSNGNYHPVGNTYGPLVNMSQAWRVQVPTTEPEGNWGEIEGSPAAADRYTEIKLSVFGEALLFDDMPSKRHTTEQEPHTIVPCSVAYTDLHWEEDYFPAKLPLVLLNGSNGIAVGMAQTFQPLAYTPLLTELRHYLAKGQIRYENLRLGYPGKPRITSSQESFIEALKTGRGSVRTTGAYTLEKNRTGAITAVIFTSVPAQATLNGIGDAFNEWRTTAGQPIGKGQTVPECVFSRCDNESEPTTVRLVFPLRRPMPLADLRPHLFQLIRRAKLSDSYTVNMNALRNRFPVQYSLEQLFKDWLLERSEIIKRVALARLVDLRAQRHRVNVLVWVRDNLEQVAPLLKEAEDAAAIRVGLQALDWAYTFAKDPTADDVDLVLGINLRQVSRLNNDEVTKRRARLDSDIEASSILRDDPDARDAQIDADLAWFLSNVTKLGVRDCACEFDPDLATLLDASPKNAPALTVPLAEAPVKGKPDPTTESGWWTASLGKGADLDIILYTAMGALLRLSNKSVRSTPYTPNLINADDRIVGAFYSAAPQLLLLADNSRLLQVPKDSLPYGQLVYPAKIALAIKASKPFTHLVPAAPTSDAATHLLFMGEKGSARRTPLADIASLRMGSDFPEPVRHFGFVSDKVKAAALGDAFLGDALTTLNLGKIPEGSLKRTGKLPSLPLTGALQRTENNMTIGVTPDGKGVFKVL